ncbi:hypothetical protein ACFYOF_16925 [Streptomyces sp. NPDC007148]|uniref:hypothetical protein n=1 Tax=Streptomyces sp. NPDC007148 TaxID=3364775 RepID=UPI00369DFBFC
MSFFNLRKRATEDEPEPSEAEQAEEIEEEPDEEAPAAAHGPILTGLLGPGQWIAARFGSGVSWGLYVVAVWAIGFYGGWVAAGIVLAWLLAVGSFIPGDILERAAAVIERRSAPARKTAGVAPGSEREAVRRLLLDVMGDADKVHLKTVLAHLQKHGQWQGRTVTDMRTRLTALGIPHDRNVKVAGVPTWGVRRAPLEAPSRAPSPTSSPAPSPPV